MNGASESDVNNPEITQMVPPFDLFKREPDGKLRWIEAAESLEAAQERIYKFMELSGEYVIFSRKTQNKILMRSDSVSNA